MEGKVTGYKAALSKCRPASPHYGRSQLKKKPLKFAGFKQPRQEKETHVYTLMSSQNGFSAKERPCVVMYIRSRVSFQTVHIKHSITAKREDCSTAQDERRLLWCMIRVLLILKK